MSRRAAGGDRPYAWLIAAALSLTVTVSYGVLTYAFGVLLPQMQRDLGWSRSALTGAFSLALLVAALAGVAVGVLLDRTSPRLLMSVGSLLGAGSVLAWSRVHSLFGLYVTFTLVGVAMSTLLYEAAFTVTAKWFSYSRRRALTLITLVGASASLIFSPLTEALSSAHGWRGALVRLAAILAITTVPLHALVLRKAPMPAVSPHQWASPSRRNALRSRGFALLTAGFMFASFSSSAIAVFLVSLLLRSGHQASLAATIAGILGIAQLPGRLSFGIIGRAVDDAGLIRIVFGLAAVALGLLAVDRSTPAAVTFAVLFGASNGMVTLLRATLIGDLYGSTHYGAIFAVAAGASNIARALAPVAASLMLLLPGAFATMLWCLVGLALLGAVTATAAVREIAGFPPEATHAPAGGAPRGS